MNKENQIENEVPRQVDTDQPKVKRKNKSRFPPFAVAKAQALDLQMPSSYAYKAWHKKNKIKYLPRFPDRVYREWVSWNDYLGTNNEYKGEHRKKVRPYWEAVTWAQQICKDNQLSTVEDYKIWAKENKDKLPADIPLHPDGKYVKEWEGWGIWLGNTVKAKVEVAKQELGLIAICSMQRLSLPGNSYSIIESEGEGEIIDAFNRDMSLRMVKCYNLPKQDRELVYSLLNKHGRNNGDFWFIPNVSNLIFELDQMLIVYRRK